jgi:hypothetical protein
MSDQLKYQGAVIFRNDNFFWKVHGYVTLENIYLL